MQTGDTRSGPDGPASPAQRIKAHRGGDGDEPPSTPHEEKFGVIWAPLPTDDSALGRETHDEGPPQSPAQRYSRQMGGPSAPLSMQMGGPSSQGAGGRMEGGAPGSGTPINMQILAEGAAYVRCVQDQGDIPGYVFQRGDQGLGYYRVGPARAGAPHQKPAAGAPTGQAVRGRNQMMGSNVAGAFGTAMNSSWGGVDPTGNGRGRPNERSAGGTRASKHAPTNLW